LGAYRIIMSSCRPIDIKEVIEMPAVKRATVLQYYIVKKTDIVASVIGPPYTGGRQCMRWDGQEIPGILLRV
jgi:hypothetical protein